MQSIYKIELIDRIRFVEHQVRFILESTAEVKDSQDFLTSMNGMVLFNSTCMCLQSVGESIRQIDNKTDKRLLCYYPEIPWKEIIGMRNIISHEYLSIDPDLVFDILSEELHPLLTTVQRLLEDINKGVYDDFFIRL